MNGNEVVDDSMTLEQKLSAIEQAMENAQLEHRKTNPGAAPLDPSDLTICDGCS